MAADLQVMSEDECVQLLRAHTLGRLGLVNREQRPLIFPVNYFFDEGAIVFRTAPGSKLDLAPGAPACFEIDGWNESTGEGWSVLAKGLARDITNPRGAPTGRMRYWPVNPVAPGSREHWVALLVSEVSGRKFGTA